MRLLPRFLAGSALALGLGAASCSGDDGPTKQFPTEGEVRDYYALNPGNCYRYRIPAKQTFGRVEVTGPNMQSIAGRTVFDQELFLDTAERPYRWQFEVGGEAEVRLLRWITGSGSQQTTKRYEAVEPPLFAKLDYDRMSQPQLEPGARFEVESAPEVCGQGSCEMPGTLEQHAWTVLEDKKMVPTPDGEMEAVQLQYRLTIEGTTQTARYDLVPGKGVASFTDFDGTIHTICAWKVCDGAGVCSVATPCSELACD